MESGRFRCTSWLTAATGWAKCDSGPLSWWKPCLDEPGVNTSRPTPREFQAVYTEAIRAGTDTVVSVHLSRRLSDTWESARLAAEQVGAERVKVVDSRSTGMGLSFAALAVAVVAASGADQSTVSDAAERVGARTRTFFSVDTLEYLRRGAGSARGLPCWAPRWRLSRRRTSIRDGLCHWRRFAPPAARGLGCRASGAGSRLGRWIWRCITSVPPTARRIWSSNYMCGSRC
jgi:Uncharacterised protein, DegV family COG1307